MAVVVCCFWRSNLITIRHDGRSPSHNFYDYISWGFVSLNSIHWRETNKNEEFWTIDDLPSGKRPNLPLYILTSKDTFSAAEEFAYNLKVRKRAYIVGETTKGGANPGHFFDLPSRLSIFIPTGTAVDPITKTNWEGVGVAPHLPVIAVLAFEEAYAMA
jgi:C-terminal processing protease CtpA/Prc